jgi:hypothetical protein
MAGNDIFVYGVPTDGANDVRLYDPTAAAGAGGAVTAPTVAASFAWSASVVAPVIDVLAPAVSAGLVWSASAAAPLVGVNAPAVSAVFAWSAVSAPPLIDVNAASVSASFAWSAAAGAPSTGGAGTTAPDVAASFTWSADALAPNYDTLAADAAGSFAWAAAVDAPVIDGQGTDVVAAAVFAELGFISQVQTPVLVQYVGNMAGYDQIARRARARMAWGAMALPPVIGKPRRPTMAPAASASFEWCARCPMPIALQISAPRPSLVRSQARVELVRSKPLTIIRTPEHV